MAIATNSTKDWLDVYDGFDSRLAGPGTDPSIYSSETYAKKKTQKILIGGLTQIQYAGWENDALPLILTLGYEAKYNTIMSMNVNYIPYRAKKAIIDLVIKSNIARIKSKKPIIINYNLIKRALPMSQYIIRRYKLQLIKVIDTVPLIGWNTAIKKKSKWEQHYKSGKSKLSIPKKLARSK